MAFTGSPTNSLQYADQLTSQMADPVIAIGKMRIAAFKYTHVAGAGTGEINLIKLPAGLIRVYNLLSHLRTSAFASTADIDVGHRAYTNMDGTAVAELADMLADGLDAATGGNLGLPEPLVGFKDYDSQDGVVIFATVLTANIEDTDTIDGYIVYAQV